MEPRKDDKSLGELFSELSRDTAELVRKEVQLARTEMTARASKVGRHVVFIAIGGFIAYAGASPGGPRLSSSVLSSRSPGTCSFSEGSRGCSATASRLQKPLKH